MLSVTHPGWRPDQIKIRVDTASFGPLIVALRQLVEDEPSGEITFALTVCRPGVGDPPPEPVVEHEPEPVLVEPGVCVTVPVPSPTELEAARRRAQAPQAEETPKTSAEAPTSPPVATDDRSARVATQRARRAQKRQEPAEPVRIVPRRQKTVAESDLALAKGKACVQFRVCPDCAERRSFPSEEALAAHIRADHNQAGLPYVCSCGDAFAKPMHWTDHRARSSNANKQWHVLASKPPVVFIRSSTPPAKVSVDEARRRAFDLVEVPQSFDPGDR